MRRHTVAAAMLGAALCLASPPSFAQEAVVQLAPAAANVVESRLSTGVAPFSGEIRLRNTATDPAGGLRRLTTATLLVRASDGASVPATWARTNGGDPRTLEAGHDAVLTLSATLAEPGVYETWIETAPADGAAEPQAVQRIRVLVTRTADILPAEFLVEPKPVGQTWGGLSSLRLSDAARTPDAVFLTLRNATTRPVEFTAPAIVAFTQTSGDAETAVATTRPPRIEAEACVSPLGAGKACGFKLLLEGRLLPGEYAIDIGVAGVGGGWSERTQIVRVRSSALIAFLVIVAGAAAGWYVNLWRGSGRRALSGLIDIARLRDRLRGLDPLPADAVSRRLVTHALARADNVETALRKGTDQGDAFAALDAHAGRLAAAVEVGRGLGKLPQAGRDALDARWNALAGTLDAAAGTEAEAGEVEARLKALAADITEWPKLDAASRAAAELADAVQALTTAAGNDVAAGEAASLPTTLQAAIEHARGPLGDEPVLSRRETLDGAVSTGRVAASDDAGTALARLDTLLAAAAAKAHDAATTAQLATLANKAAAMRASSANIAVEARLKELAALWQSYRNLAFAIDPSIMAQAAGADAAAVAIGVPGLPAIDVPTDVLLPAWGSPLVLLERKRRRHERLTNLVILLATGLGGLLALWSPDPTWGSVIDMVTAFLAGMAAHVVVGEAVARPQ